MRKNLPVVGDFVGLDDSGLICKIFERSSFFIRPNVANVDCVNIVIAHAPKPDYMLVDKLIAQALSGGAEAIITINKCDEVLVDYVIETYKNAVSKIFTVSAVTGSGIDELKDYLKGKLVAFAGQSAVGKTSLINKIFGGDFRVGNLSRKTNRGKNTTTYSRIVESGEIRVVDTPGFTSFYMQNFTADDLKNYYKEFENTSCFYRDCTHLHEPSCGVKELVDLGKINLDRYNRYTLIYKEIKGDKWVKF